MRSLLDPPSLVHLRLEDLLQHSADHLAQPIRVRKQMSLTAALADLPSVLVMAAFLRGNQVTLNITSLP
jgi:hypothetical protein